MTTLGVRWVLKCVLQLYAKRQFPGTRGPCETVKFRVSERVQPVIWEMESYLRCLKAGWPDKRRFQGLIRRFSRLRFCNQRSEDFR